METKVTEEKGTTTVNDVINDPQQALFEKIKTVENAIGNSKKRIIKKGLSIENKLRAEEQAEENAKKNKERYQKRKQNQKPPVEDETKPPVEDETKPPVEDETKPPIEPPAPVRVPYDPILSIINGIGMPLAAKYFHKDPEACTLSKDDMIELSAFAPESSIMKPGYLSYITAIVGKLSEKFMQAETVRTGPPMRDEVEKFLKRLTPEQAKFFEDEILKSKQDQQANNNNAQQ